MCVSPKSMANSMIIKPSNKNKIINEPEIERTSKKRSIRRFMKQQKRKFNKEKILERSQEIKKHSKVKENLKILNKYVRHIRTHSTGMGYHRSTGASEHRKRYRMYKGFEKARTPKYNDAYEIDFK